MKLDDLEEIQLDSIQSMFHHMNIKKSIFRLILTPSQELIRIIEYEYTRLVKSYQLIGIEFHSSNKLTSNQINQINQMISRIPKEDNKSILIFLYTDSVNESLMKQFLSYPIQTINDFHSISFTPFLITDKEIKQDMINLHMLSLCSYLFIESIDTWNIMSILVSNNKLFRLHL